MLSWGFRLGEMLIDQSIPLFWGSSIHSLHLKFGWIGDYYTICTPESRFRVFGCTWAYGLNCAIRKSNRPHQWVLVCTYADLGATYSHRRVFFHMFSGAKLYMKKAVNTFE
jgi:hypothetical protein